MEQGLLGRQHVSFSQHQQKSVEILQSSLQELEAIVQTEIEENPFLSMEDSCFLSSNTLSPPPREEHLETQDEIWEEIVTNKNKEAFGGVSSISVDLLIESQINGASFSQLHRRIAGELRFLLDEKGFLEKGYEEAIERLGFDVSDIEQTVRQLQKLEPTGIFARSLSECFMLQLEEKGLYNGTLEKIVNAVPRVKNVYDLCKLVKLPYSVVATQIQLLKNLSVAPLNILDQKIDSHLVPDVIVRFDSFTKKWQSTLNETYSPKVSIDRASYQRYKYSCIKEEEKAYIQDRISRARWLLGALLKRKKTLLLVSQAIVDHQEPFFKNGSGALRPLSLKDIAEMLSIHESTVSRATKGKYMETPKGIHPLRFFFSVGVNSLLNSWNDERIASRRIQVMLKEIIQTEPRDNPYSDQNISNILGKKGVIVARRTIAKYRMMCRIPSASRRRGFAFE